MRQLSLCIVGAALLATSPLFAVAQDKKKDDPKGATGLAAHLPLAGAFRHLDGRPLVFVVNGVGGSTQLSDNLIDLNSDCNLGLRIHPIAWTRHNASFQDLVDCEAQLNAAARLACLVTAVRRDCPNMPIYLMGHSAGARVVLAAAEMATPKCIDRIVVLAPAVAWSYDLTGALRASRAGIDNFYSPEDGVLESAVYHHVLADGTKGPAAGRVGFRPASNDKKDFEAYRMVRNYRWNEDHCGNGGHCAWLIRHNLKKTVVPVLLSGIPIDYPPSTIRAMPPVQ